jgi:hypothetical protein
LGSALIFGIAVIVAMGAVGLRRYQAKSHLRGWQKAPGHSMDRPIRVETYDAIDHLRLRERCHCGATLHRLGEESRTGPGGAKVTVTCECVDCDELRLLYFDLSEIAH